MLLQRRLLFPLSKHQSNKWPCLIDNFNNIHCYSTTSSPNRYKLFVGRCLDFQQTVKSLGNPVLYNHSSSRHFRTLLSSPTRGGTSSRLNQLPAHGVSKNYSPPRRVIKMNVDVDWSASVSVEARHSADKQQNGQQLKRQGQNATSSVAAHLVVDTKKPKITTPQSAESTGTTCLFFSRYKRIVLVIFKRFFLIQTKSCVTYNQFSCFLE